MPSTLRLHLVSTTFLAPIRWLNTRCLQCRCPSPPSITDPSIPVYSIPTILDLRIRLFRNIHVSSCSLEKVVRMSTDMTSSARISLVLYCYLVKPLWYVPLFPSFLWQGLMRVIAFYVMLWYAFLVIVIPILLSSTYAWLLSSCQLLCCSRCSTYHKWNVMLILDINSHLNCLASARDIT